MRETGSAGPAADERVERRSPTGIPISEFTTERLPPGEKMPAWRASIDVMFDARRSSRDGLDGFEAHVRSYLLDTVMIARCRAGFQKFDRTPVRIAADGIDHYMFQVFLSGHVEMRRGSRAFRAGPGQVIGFDLAEVLDSWNSDFDVLSVFVPRQRLAPLLEHPDSAHGLTVPATGLGRLLAENVVLIHREAPTLTIAEAFETAEILTMMIASTLNQRVDDSGAVSRSVAFNNLARIKAYIRDALADPDLGPDAIAIACGVSRAALFRLFRQQGGVRRYVAELRLRVALRLLVAPRMRHRAVSEIAYRCGFTSPSVFSRAFRERYRMTPGQARAAAMARPPWQGPADDPRIGDGDYAAWIASLA